VNSILYEGTAMMSTLTIACRERIRFPQRIFVTSTPFTCRLIRVLEANITSVNKQQARNLEKLLTTYK